ncbi:MAG: PAS domain-containing protein [Alphaproteobacteria bacterium]|nr:PAS domain-containing protein [Alphaproteobacteria bacterium]
MIPLALLGGVSYYFSRQTVEKLSDRFVAEVLAGRRDLLELQARQIESLVANISGVEGIVSALRETSAAADTYTRLATQARIGYILNGYLNIEGLVSIDILAADGRHFHVGETLDVEIGDGARAAQVFDRAAASDRPVHWFGVVDSLNANSSHRQVISAAKIVWGVDRQTVSRYPIAVVVVNYSLDTLRNQLSGVDLGSDSALMVIDAQGRLLFHPEDGRVGRRVSESLIAALAAEGESGSVTLGGIDMAVFSVRIERTEWRLVAAIPQHTLSAPTTVIGGATVASLFLCLVVVAGAATLYARRVVDPIKAVTERFRAARAMPDRPVEALPVRGDDEIADLAGGFNAFMQAVAERRAAADALVISEERYSLAMRGANDGLWDWDLETDTLYLSPRWFQMLGLEEAGGPGAPAAWLGRIHPEDRGAVEAGIRAHLDGETAHFESEHRVRHADGSWIWFLARGLAVRNEAEAPQRMAGSCTDITERKAAAERLIRARDDAEAANRAKSEFLAMMSHELRTPLNAIIGFSDMIAEELYGPLGDARYMHYAQDIKASGERLLGNINMILDLSKIDSDQIELNEDLISLADLARLPQRMLAGMAAKGGVYLRCCIPADLPVVRGDARLIEQAVTNLMSNAVKASHRGGTVELSAARDVDGSVTLQVADQGIGMNPDEIEIAVTPFGQVSSGYCRTQEGTGLGLPLSKRIIEKHGGTLTIRSARGAGTVVRARFPASRVVAETAPLPAPRVRSG